MIRLPIVKLGELRGQRRGSEVSKEQHFDTLIVNHPGKYGISFTLGEISSIKTFPAKLC